MGVCCPQPKKGTDIIINESFWPPLLNLLIVLDVFPGDHGMLNWMQTFAEALSGKAWGGDVWGQIAMVFIWSSQVDQWWTSTCRGPRVPVTVHGQTSIINMHLRKLKGMLAGMMYSWVYHVSMETKTMATFNGNITLENQFYEVSRPRLLLTQLGLDHALRPGFFDRFSWFWGSNWQLPYVFWMETSSWGGHQALRHLALRACVPPRLAVPKRSLCFSLFRWEVACNGGYFPWSKGLRDIV